MFKKLFLIVLFFLLLLVTSYLLPAYVLAADEFATSYDVIYDVGSDGITTVTEKIILRNLTSQYYANQFKITIGATQIWDVKASDGGGAMEVVSEQKDTSTSITVKFNQQVAGLGKMLPWTLQFKSKDFAEKSGKVWEVRAPKISSTSNLEFYNLTISVPENFGEPTLISPIPKSQTSSSGKIFLTFDKPQLETSGVSANFGTSQLFDFDLSYHLENNSLVPIVTHVALPPDTAYQDVIYQRIDPKPLNVTVDDDGNYLAWFKLSRNQKMDVKVIGSAKLYTNSKVKNPTLDESLRKKYTQKDVYWEKDNPQIASKLEEILGINPPAQTEEKAKLIYQYVVSTLKYDSSRLKGNLERLGAVTALNNPQSAVCMEFTDLFIALARAANIPTRELNGSGYTQNTKLRPLSLTRGADGTKDILHAWPEYFDEKKGWVMVDPTWENTTGGVDYFAKLDLNHFTFVTRGFSSSQPIPAGSYKRSLRLSNNLRSIGEDSHDVKVTLSETDFLGKPQIEVDIDTPNPILALFPTKIKVKISNVGNSIYPSTNLAMKSNKLAILDSKEQKLGPIPAFGTASFDFNVRTTRQPFGFKSLFDSYDDQIEVYVGSQKFVKDVKIKPFLIFQTIPAMLVGVGGLIAIVYFVILGGFIYRKRFLKKGKK